MNKHNPFAIALFVACIISACSNNNVDEELTLSREVSKELGTQLKSKLVSTMQSSGPDAAIAVCNLEAINITADISDKNNLVVGRTSLKIRNPANKPDAWETKQLEWFESQLASGVDVKTLEKNEIVKEKGKKIFRYMKAIPMQEPCMLCHGEVISTAIKEKINDLYPQDQATGYKVGELRGAFTIKIEM